MNNLDQSDLQHLSGKNTGEPTKLTSITGPTEMIVHSNSRQKSGAKSGLSINNKVNISAQLLKSLNIQNSAGGYQPR